MELINTETSVAILDVVISVAKSEGITIKMNEPLPKKYQDLYQQMACLITESTTGLDDQSVAIFKKISDDFDFINNN
jgi:hypothetical protein